MQTSRTGDSALRMLLIEDLTREGIGLGRLDGQVVLVEGSLPGDRVQVRLMHQARRHAVGRLVSVLEPSPDRRRPPCILSDRCGGCTLQALSDSGQQRWKEHAVAETLQRIGHVSMEARPLLVAPDGLGYRNRAVIPLERDQQGKLRAGYYRRGSHQIVNMNRCPVLDPRLDEMVAPLKADLEASDWPVNRHGGADTQATGLRHLALRIGRRSGERLLTLITSHDDLPGLREMADRWLDRWPDIVGVTLNLQPDPGNRLFGQRNLTIKGRDWIREPFCDVDLKIGPDTFFQVYSEQAEQVVTLLREELGTPKGLIVEGYCGIGTFSLPLARDGWAVLGIEHHGATVELAKANALLNGLEAQCRFLQGDVALLLDQAMREEGVDTVLLDPPRKGLQEAVLASLLQHRPALLLYLSCDPATLARDVGRLCSEGDYGIRSLQPLDFFPNTSHVECLAVLHRPIL